MSRALVALLLVAGGCRGDKTPLPKFDIDVEVAEGWTDQGEPKPEERRVRVSLTDLGAGCKHDSADRPEPGHCGGWSDVIAPPCGDWHCLREIRVEHRGGVLDKVSGPRAAGLPDRSWVALYIPAHTSGARVVIEGCGQRVELPISTELPSAPEVTHVTRGADGFEVAWTGADDADVIEVSAGQGFGGTICAQRERTPAKFPLTSFDTLSGLTARSAIAEQATPFGPAHVWRVARTQFEDGLFPAAPRPP